MYLLYNVGSVSFVTKLKNVFESISHTNPPLEKNVAPDKRKYTLRAKQKNMKTAVSAIPLNEVERKQLNSMKIAVSLFTIFLAVGRNVVRS